MKCERGVCKRGEGGDTEGHGEEEKIDGGGG